MHTPAPWFVSDSPVLSIVGQENFPTICEITLIRPEGGDDEEIYANANVLSAAPDMLDVLPDLLEHSISHYGNPVDETSGIGLIHAKTRAAIAKGRGE